MTTLLLSLTLLLLAACAPPQTATPGGPAAEGAGPRATKRMVGAITGDPHTFTNKLNPGSNVPGIDILEQLLHSSLTRNNDRGETFALLAEQIPTLENGLWKTFPDGRMEVTWKLRPAAQWHDGVPFTVDDLMFSIQVGQDREVPALRSSTFDLIGRAEAIDKRTLTLHYKQPFIDADGFSYTPFPKHVLEQAYRADKATLTDHPYFVTDEFIGTGPFKIREWVRGSHVILAANDRYFLGRPKIDELEVKFIPDQNTLVANVLAGTVDVVMSRGLSLDQGLTVRAQWKEGRMEANQKNWVAFYVQHINPNPAVVTNLQFRRALLHALDRQSLADSVYAGLVPVAHVFLSQLEPLYTDVESLVPRYEYDPRKATELIQSLGYTRGADGKFRDAAGQTIPLPIRSTATRAERTQMLFAIVDAWQQLGIAAEPDIAPPQMVRDREFQSTYAALEFTQQPNGLSALKNFHTSQSPLPGNRWQGSNRSRYSSPQLDAITDQYLTTIPLRERVSLIGQIVQFIGEQLPGMGVVYGMDTMLIANRLRNVGPNEMTWNAHEWDVTS